MYLKFLNISYLCKLNQYFLLSDIIILKKLNQTLN
jgi:hypothetical protein